MKIRAADFVRQRNIVQREVLEEQNHHQPDDPHGADPAVLHDPQHPLPVLAARQAVDEVGDAVKMQPPGNGDENQHAAGSPAPPVE